jgi:hypothetical protein
MGQAINPATIGSVQAISGSVNFGNPYANSMNGTGYQRIGATRYGLSAAGAGSNTIVAPASNVNGLVLRSICIEISVGGAGNDLGVFADTAAPANWNDVTKNRIIALKPLNTLSMPELNVFLPVGFGLYWYSDLAGQRLWCSYDIL